MSKSTKLAVLPPEKANGSALAAIETDFANARAYADEIRGLGARAHHLSILLGHELVQLHKKLGIKAGNPQLYKDCTIGPKVSWKDLCEQQTGFSYASCQNCMNLAIAIRSKIKLLTSPDVASKPFMELPPARRKEVLTAIRKVSDGQTMQDLMRECGVIKQRKNGKPPPGGKSEKNDFKGGAANRGEKEELLEAWRNDALEVLEGLKQLYETDVEGEVKKYFALEPEDLAEFRKLLSQVADDIDSHCARQRGKKPNSERRAKQS